MKTLEIPSTLPVENLSASSISTYIKCPERWRRRYILNEYEPPSGALILGSSVHAAETSADHADIDGKRLATPAIQDVFSDEWDWRSEREEVDWGDEKPGDLKDTGIAAIAAYERDVGPSLEPVRAERRFELSFQGVEWGLLGYIDMEQADGSIVDRKVRARKMGKVEADTELAVAPYMLARRAEDDPAPIFAFHTFVKTKTPYAEIVLTNRTERQLEAFVDRVYGIAAEIAWRMENDVWAGAVPGSWWCSERFCGFWPSCPMGGLQ